MMQIQKTSRTKMFSKLAQMRIALALQICGAGVAVCSFLPAPAQNVTSGSIGNLSAPTLVSADSGNTVHITVGRSIVLQSHMPLRRVYVGNPAVLQTFTSGENQVVMTAKAAGVSSMVIWEDGGESRLYTVFADLDPLALRASLRDAFPDADIHAETGEDKVFLTGTVTSDAAFEAAAKMASQYAKNVVNSLKVAPVHGRQVQLKLRIVEVDRTRLDQLGINIFSGGHTTVATTTGQYASAVSNVASMLTVSNPMEIFLYNSKLNVGLTVQDLEQKQVLQVLAEPTLTTLSGLQARFLSGGEFPFPVVQGGTGNSTAIAIQFRPYGVKVDFTPTVNADGSIHLKLSPEVSTLDYSNAVTISGFTIPALSTRRAETEVEIQNGQSFIVSGLLDHRTTEIMSKAPGIGDLPILGQLFRSKNVNHSVVELVIVVTASVVDPLLPETMHSSHEPTFVVPNLDTDAFDVAARKQAGITSAGPSPSATPSIHTNGGTEAK